MQPQIEESSKRVPVSFAGQRDFLACLPSIISISERHGLDAARWREFEARAGDFRLKAPFIGAFSNGKTSLINALLGEKLFSVDVTPETAIAAHIVAAPQFRAELVRTDGSRVPVQADDLRHNRLADYGPAAHVEVGHPALTRWPHLLLLDLPGWGSGLEAHEKVIDAHAAESLAYVLVVSADEGTLRKSMERALVELGAWGLPVVLVINKIDKRLPAEVASIAEGVARSVEALSGRAPLVTVLASARKGNIGPLEQALDTLEARADERFAAGVIAPALTQLQGLAQHLEMLAAQRFTEREALDAEREALLVELALFAERLATETQKLRERIAPIQDVLRRRLLDGLGGHLEHYLGLAEGGGDLGDAMLFDARTLIAQTLRDEFDPAVTRYLGELEQALPQHLPLALTRNNKESVTADSGAPRALVALVAVLTPLLSAHPVGRIVALVAPIVASLFVSQRQQELQELEEARAQERLRKQVQGAIERVVAELVQSIGPQLDARIAEAEQAVAQRVQRERAERESVLAQLDERISAGEASASEVRARAQHDKEQIDQTIAALSALLVPSAAACA